MLKMAWSKKDGNTFATNDGRYTVKQWVYPDYDLRFFSAIVHSGTSARTLAYSYDAKDCFWACKQHYHEKWTHEDVQEWRVENFWHRLVRAAEAIGRSLKPHPHLEGGWPCPRNPAESVY